MAIAEAKQPVSMADYANQLMTQRAEETKNKYAGLQEELKKATPKFTGTSTGVSTKDNFNPAVRSGKDPFAPEERKKLGVFESYIGQMPALYDPMRFSEAMSFARFRNDPFYQQQLDQMLNSQNKAAVRTGFYGQLPSEQLKQNAISDVEASRQQQNFESAMGLLKADENSKYMQYGLQYQGYRDMMDDLLKDLNLVNTGYTTDWNRNYQSWQESFNQYIQEQQLALQREALELQRQQMMAAMAAAGGGTASGGGRKGSGSGGSGGIDKPPSGPLFQSTQWSAPTTKSSYAPAWSSSAVPGQTSTNQNTNIKASDMARAMALLR